MSYYALTDSDWAWDDEAEGRAIVVRADTPEEAVKIATDKHIAEFPGAGGICWKVTRLWGLGFEMVDWEDDNKPKYDGFNYYPDGRNGPMDRPVNPQALASVGGESLEYLARLRSVIADAEADIAQDYADAETTGERPDLHGNEITLSLEDAKALKSALSAQVQDVAGSPAIKAIAAERRRQIEKEGWTPEHDDKYTSGELLEAATCYALHNGGELDDAPGAWPWSRDFWKPTSRQRDLEKAGALIAAELDRVIRAAAPAKQEGGE